MPLKGIPRVISPELLHVLASMGHKDELVLADAQYPSSHMCRFGPKEIRADGIGIPQLLEAILTLFPLDQHVNQPVALMGKVPGDTTHTPIWTEYQLICDKAEGRQISIEKVEYYQFYERTKKAFAIVHTGELAGYGNIIIRKGFA